MRFRPLLLALMVLSIHPAFSLTERAEDAQAAPNAPVARAPHPVMTWAPPYGVDKSLARLNESFDGEGLPTGITHLALQFWVPTVEGGTVVTPKYPSIKDETIARFVQWGREHHVCVLLCVYNYLDNWDWSTARSAFADHPKEFAAALAAEVERLHLDGVDIDLEGEGEHEADKEPFLHFIQELSPLLHAKGRQLTVDSFSYRWSAPNQTWWADLFPHVDYVTTMGYEHIGYDAAEWRSYAAQKEAAGPNANKLLIGVPSHKDEWQNHTAQEQIDWLITDGSMGIGIWDAQLEAPAWRTKELWEKVRKISGRPAGAESRH